MYLFGIDLPLVELFALLVLLLTVLVALLAWAAFTLKKSINELRELTEVREDFYPTKWKPRAMMKAAPKIAAKPPTNKTLAKIAKKTVKKAVPATKKTISAPKKKRVLTENIKRIEGIMKKLRES